MIIMKAGERRTVSINANDQYGNPLEIDEAITWVSTDNSIIIPSTIRGTAAYDCTLVSPKGKIGACQIVALVDTNLTPNGSISSVNVINKGDSYTSVPAVVFEPPPIPQAAIGLPIVQDGRIIGIDFSYNTGCGYIIPPLISFSPSRNGVTATGTVDILQGSISNVNISNAGTNYIQSTTCLIDPPLNTLGEVIGAAATAIPVVQNGKVIGVQMANPGENYHLAQNNPTVTFSLPQSIPSNISLDVQKESLRATGELIIDKDGNVTNIKIKFSGKYYLTGATVIATPPSTDTRVAAGIAVLTGNKITAIEMLDVGRGYIEPPKITIGGFEKPAKLKLNIIKNKITDIIIIDGGLGYVPDSNPTITISYPTEGKNNLKVAATATAQVSPDGIITSVTVNANNYGYSAAKATIKIDNPPYNKTATATCTIVTGTEIHLGKFDVMVIPADTSKVNLVETNINMVAGTSTLLNVTTTDKYDNISSVQGIPTWEIMNDNICSIQPSVDGMSCLIKSNGKTGRSQVLVKADVDLSDGRYNIADLCNITVINGSEAIININGF